MVSVEVGLGGPGVLSLREMVVFACRAIDFHSWADGECNLKSVFRKG